jgi:2,4-dienoyl-CoA reductase-like NADH-dependent reductase (Old Yellow Enzyme family)/thioredoxin reductase
MDATFRHLLEPLDIGPVTLHNRIVSTAHQTNLIAEHLPTDDFIAYHEARACGGTGMIILEAAAVHPSGLLTAKTLSAYLPESQAALRRVADAVRPHGTRLFVQLFHGGREQIAVPPRSPVLAPSAVPSQRFRIEPRALDPEEIDELVEGYGTSARTCAAAGLDGVELSAAHNYLLASFFDPTVNRRDDEWADGSRLLRAVIDRVRRDAPSLALGIRVSADAAVSEAIVRAAGDAVHYVHATLGDASSVHGAAGIVPPPPVAHERVLAAAGTLRTAAPLIVTARFTDPADADAAVREGRASAVGMTRALITDPDLPRKLAAGRAAEVVRCIGCNACIAHYHDGTGIGCTQNPRTGRERRMAPPRRTAATRIAIVGAGPAGLAAAAEAVARGHHVVIFEAADEIGGQLRLYRDAPGQRELAATMLRNYEPVLRSPASELRLSTSADAATLAEADPDLVLLACGAAPFLPPLDGAGLPVSHAWDVLDGARPQGDVVVADWSGDPSGLDAAEVLAQAGARVTLAFGSYGVGEGLHQYRRALYLERLYRAGVEIRHHLQLCGAGAGGARFRNTYASDQEIRIPADHLVIAQGRVPVAAPDVRPLGVAARRIGDCDTPRSLEEAVLDATIAVQQLTSRGRRAPAAYLRS